MKSIASLLSIIALGFGLLSCSSSGGGGGGGSTPAFAVSTTAANFGVVGNTYTSTLSATGGTPPYTWTDVATALPLLGLVLDTATGVISGTPTAPTANAFTATFQVTDFGGRTASGSVTLRLRPRTDRASVDTAGNSITGSSNTEPSINRTDGRLIAFSSTAPNLVAGVAGNQVYVHDRQTGQPSLVSQSSAGVPGTGGTSNAPSISADGRYIAFVSTANLTGVTGKLVYRHDRLTGQTILVSKNNSGIASDGTDNDSPSISADGRFIAYVSNAANLVGNFGQQIYLHDTQTSVTFPNGQTTLVSKDGSGSPATSGSSNTSPAISADGRFIAFVSDATNLGATGTQQVYFHDTQGGQTILISKDNTTPIPAQGNGDSSTPSMSSDGCFVVFTSAATSLGAPANQIHARGPLAIAGCAGTEQTTLVSKNNTGVASNGVVFGRPAINSDGRFITFVSSATNLVAPVTGQQVYRHDTQIGANGENVVVSLNSAGLPGGSSTAPSITDDGGFVAFSSSAPLIPPAAAVDVYVRAVP